MLSYHTVEKIKSFRVHSLPQNSSKVGVFCLATTPRSRQETDACFFLLPYAMSNADEDEHGSGMVGIKGNQQL